MSLTAEETKAGAYESLRDAIKSGNTRKMSEIFAANPDIEDEVLEGKDSFEKNLMAPPPAKEEKHDQEKAGAPAAGSEKKKVKVEMEFEEDEIDAGPDESKRDAIRRAMQERVTAKNKNIYLEEEKLPELQRTIESVAAERDKYRAEAEEAKKRIPAAEKEKPAKPAKEIKLPQPPKDEAGELDFLDGAYQKSMAETLKAIIDDRDEWRAKAESVAGRVEEVNTRLEQVHNRSAVEELRSKAEIEMEEIEKIRKADKEKLVFKGSKPIEDTEKEYIRFLGNIARQAGVKDPDTVIANGVYRPEVMAAYEVYGDETKGKELRDRCAARGITAPDELDDLMALYDIRNIRAKRFEQTASGEYRNIPYSEAYEKYVKDNLDINKLRLAERKKGMEDAEHAASQKGSVKEAPKDLTANPLDMTKISSEQYNALINKPVRSEAENEILRQIFKQKSIFSDEQIEQYLKGD